MILKLSRRRVLFAGTLSLVPVRLAFAGSRSRPDAMSSVSSHMHQILRDMFGDAAAPRAVGGAYLSEHPDERNAVHLIRELVGGHAPDDAAALARMLGENRTREFRDGETVLVDGWVLARSEARLCALTVLL